MKATNDVILGVSDMLSKIVDEGYEGKVEIEIKGGNVSLTMNLDKPALISDAGEKTGDPEPKVSTRKSTEQRKKASARKKASSNISLEERVLKALEDLGGTANKSQIHNKVGRFANANQLTRALNSLVLKGKIDYSKERGAKITLK